MTYLIPTDLEAQLYPEIRLAIERAAEGGTSTEAAINRALSLIESKLSPLYDIGKEFKQEGEARNFLLMGIARDLAIFFLYQLPEKMPVHRYQAYKDSLELLKEFARGEGTLVGLDAAPVPTDPTTPVGASAWGGIARRENYW